MAAGLDGPAIGVGVPDLDTANNQQFSVAFAFTPVGIPDIGYLAKGVPRTPLVMPNSFCNLSDGRKRL